MVNVPISPDVAARFVAYANSGPGIIDATQRSQRAVDRLRVAGRRCTLRVQLGGGWSVEVMGVYRRIDHADACYADGGPAPKRGSGTRAFRC